MEHALERRVAVRVRGRSLDGKRHETLEARLTRGGHLPVTQARSQRGELALCYFRLFVTERRQELRHALGVVGREGLLPPRGEVVVLPRSLHENFVEVSRHDRAVPVERLLQPGVVAAAHRFCNQRAIGARARQRMRLLVIEVLKTVLEVAQEHVRLGELAHGVRIEQPALREERQHVERRLAPQRRIAAAADQLEELHDELDFADAAGPELDVVGDIAALDLRAHLPVQIAHRREGAVIEMAAKHERPHEIHQLRAAIPGERPRFDPGVTLPLAALRDEIVFEHVEARDERPAFAVRAQPQIDAKNITVLGQLRKHCGEPPRKPREEFVIAERARAVGLAVLRIDQHEIDVRRHVELAAAELPHADDVQRLRRPAGLAARASVLLDELRVRARDCRVDGRLCERRRRGENLAEIAKLRQVACDEREHDLLPQPPQRAAETVAFGEERAQTLAHRRGRPRAGEIDARRQVRLGREQPAHVAAQAGCFVEHVAARICRRVIRFHASARGKMATLNR